MVQTNSWRAWRLGGSILILIIATFFSTLALHHARRWHPDEAFYMTIARNAAVHGDWMLVSEPLDKPPLTYYINALSLVFLAVDSDANGVLFLDVHKGEFAGRFPAWLMSIVLVAVIITMTRTATSDERIACIAGLLAALSPLRIVFAPTAFTDMPMLLFATLALWMALRGKYGWTGFWFILAFAAKPQCLFYFPLLLCVIWINLPLSQTATGAHTGTPLRKAHRWLTKNPIPNALGATCITSRRQDRGFRGRGIFCFVILMLLGALMLWIWDSARVNLGATSFWTLGQAYYTPTTLTPLSDYPARIRELWSTVQYLFGHGLITAFLLLGSTIQTLRQRNTLAILLLLWLIGFFVLHVVFTLNLHDRNLLLILPVACMWVAKALRTRYISSLQNSRIFYLCALCVFAVLSLFAFVAATGIYDIGGDDGRHDGIDALADYLNSKPIATVIYDRWLDWELDYYMGEWTNKRRVYYPTPQQLVDGALQLGETGVRYFVAPVDENITEWLTALAAANFAITLDYESANFRVYALIPP